MHETHSFLWSNSANKNSHNGFSEAEIYLVSLICNYFFHLYYTITVPRSIFYALVLETQGICSLQN